MSQPKRVKYRKQHKGRIGRIAQRGHRLVFGTFGIKAEEGMQMTSRQIEVIRVTIARTMKRGGIFLCRIFAHKAITKKPAQVRMGGGKGVPAFFVAVIKAGTILGELEGVSKEVATKAFYLAGKKLPIKTRMVIRDDYINE